MFMTGLRRIILNAPTSAPSVILRELSDLCSTSIIDQLKLPETMTDTAMRSIQYIVLEVCRKWVRQNDTILDEDLDQSRLTLLKDSVTSLNRSQSLHEREVSWPDQERYVKERIYFVTSMLTRIRRILSLNPPRPVLETVPRHPTSLLWRKLRAANSVYALTAGKEEENCSICFQGHVTQKNFGLLDKCDHMFCAQCIATWFEKK